MPAHFMIHFLAAQTVALRPNSADGSKVFSYGEELLWTDQMTMANTDTVGRCRLLDLLDDEALQVRKYGKVVVRRGPWPEGRSRLEPGSWQHTEAREAARRAAHLLPEPECSAALQKMREEFGDLPTGHTLTTYGTSR
jgi:hypothetical protein